MLNDFFLFSYVIILTHGKKYEIMHHTHLFLLIYSHAHFYNAKKYSQQIQTINLQKHKSLLIN
jgi:hypothetical protein